MSAPSTWRPVSRPPRNKPRELLLTLAIAAAWGLAAHAILGGAALRLTGPGGALPMLLALAAACWGLAELVARRWLMLWPGSALGILGPLTLGIAAGMATPELRTASALERLPVIYGTCAAGMLVYLLRFRLPGLVSPVALFSTVALFLWLTGANPEALARVEGLTPRGVLAALLDRPIIVGVFGPLALGACWLGWHLDRHADYFGVEAARPLHIVGGGISALIAGRFAGMLPPGLDLAALLGLFTLLLLWSLRIDRMAVFTTGTVAMTRPLALGVAEPLGIGLSIWDWSGVYIALVGLAMILWLLARRRAEARGWTHTPRNIRWKWTDPAGRSRRRKSEEHA